MQVKVSKNGLFRQFSPRTWFSWCYLLQTGPFNTDCMETGHTKINRSGRRRLGSLKMGKAILNVTNSLCNIYYEIQQSLWNHCYKEEFVLKKYRTEIKGGTNLHSRHFLHYALPYKLHNANISVCISCSTVKLWSNYISLYTQRWKKTHPKKGFFPIWLTINTEKGIQTWIYLSVVLRSFKKGDIWAYLYHPTMLTCLHLIVNRCK